MNNSKISFFKIKKQNIDLLKNQEKEHFLKFFKAQSLKTGEFVAIKCMKENYKNIEAVNNLAEVRALKRLSTHKNIIKLLEVLQ